MDRSLEDQRSQSSSGNAPEASRQGAKHHGSRLADFFKDSQSDFGDVNMNLIWFQGSIFMWYVKILDHLILMQCVYWFYDFRFVCSQWWIYRDVVYWEVEMLSDPTRETRPSKSSSSASKGQYKGRIEIDSNRWVKGQRGSTIELGYIIIIIKLGFMSIYVWGILDMDPNFGKR